MNSEKEQLRLSLKSIADNEYCLKENESVNDYVNLMLKYIGDSDPELRDDLIYSTFATWIEVKCYFTDEDLKSLLNTLLSNDFIFYKIGSKADDSVLRRSFSVLLINPILCHHLDKEFLDEEMIIKTKDCLIKYFIQEKDLRGYDKEIGWVHAIAHSADGIYALVYCKGITEDICKEILTTIENKMLEGADVFYAEEYERIVTVIYSIIENKLLDEQNICDWIERFNKVKEIVNSMTKFKARANIKNLIRSLYFRLLHQENNEKISKTLIELEKRINQYLD